MTEHDDTNDEIAYTNDEIAEIEGLRAEIKAIDNAPVERYRAARAVLRGDPAQCADLSGDYVRAATQALRTIANFPITDPEANMDAANMQVIALGVLPDESSDGSGSPVHQKTTRDPTPLSLQQGLATTTTTGTVGSANAAKVRDGGNVAKSEREPAQGPLPSSPDPLEADLSPSQVAQRQSAQKWRDSSIPQATIAESCPCGIGDDGQQCPDANGRPLCAAPPSQAGMRDEIAAMLLARDECEQWKPIPERLIEWGRMCVANGKDAKHSGDCTNESHSCARCITDGVLLHADQIIATSRHSGQMRDRELPAAEFSELLTDLAELNVDERTEEVLREADRRISSARVEAIEECAKFIESGAGMADLIDQDELDQQAKYLRELSSRSRSPGGMEGEQ